ncbi:hypothetical protein OK349_03340 [Sphingomonas sp. BT-65]|uniref:hypothetical protein n=1 Tax=Sphingomonas sp. BT-65 TaxID=2989821 RepID=UPI0022361D13|nr:hypothetical protein [Sphingomonas sp. BT-65]MCW4460727.1 hypothetical protein [Sphingomonas sp. BT-65]
MPAISTRHQVEGHERAKADRWNLDCRLGNAAEMDARNLGAGTGSELSKGSGGGTPRDEAAAVSDGREHELSLLIESWLAT